MRGKGSQIYAEIDVKIDDKSMRFRNLRFLVFCEAYNVKLLVSHDQGHQKSIKFQLLGSLNSDVFRGRVFGSILMSFWEDLELLGYPRGDAPVGGAAVPESQAGGTEGGKPEALSQPVDPGGVGGYDIGTEILLLQ